jgi:putative membrane protein
MKIILRLLVIAAIAFILAQFLPGVHVDGYGTAIWFAIVLGLLNVFLKPLLIIFTLPLTVITFGLFLFVINTLIVLLASNWVNGFKIDSFGWGLLFSLFLSLITSLLFREEDRQRKQREGNQG